MVLKRMLFIAVVIIVINAILISPIYAMGNIISSGKDFLQKGYLVNEVIDTSSLTNTSNFIYNLFLVVAIVLAVGVGTVLGIKFIVSSVEGQAKIKEAIIPYVVGCIVIFAAFPIWSFIVNAGKDTTGTTGNEGTEIPTTTTTITTITKAPQQIDLIYCTICDKDLTKNEIHTGKCLSCGSNTDIYSEIRYQCINTPCDSPITENEQRTGKCKECGAYIDFNRKIIKICSECEGRLFDTEIKNNECSDCGRTLSGA